MYRIHFVRQDVTYETEGGLLSQVLLREVEKTL